MLIAFIRTILLYIIVVASLRLMGKRQIGQLQPSELVIAMMISELASIPMESVGTPLLSGILPILTLLIAEATFSFIALKSRKARRIIVGRPTVLIRQGKVLEDEMERIRFNLDDLLEELRANGYTSIAEVECAIFETNGQLSIIPYSSRRPVTPADLNLNLPYEGMPYMLIQDGELIWQQINSAGISLDWLMERLRSNGVADIKEVFIASLDSTNSLFVQTKMTKEEKKAKKLAQKQAAKP